MESMENPSFAPEDLLEAVAEAATAATTDEGVIITADEDIMVSAARVISLADMCKGFTLCLVSVSQPLTLTMGLVPCFDSPLMLFWRRIDLFFFSGFFPPLALVLCCSNELCQLSLQENRRKSSSFKRESCRALCCVAGGNSQRNGYGPDSVAAKTILMFANGANWLLPKDALSGGGGGGGRVAAATPARCYHWRYLTEAPRAGND